MGRTRQSADLVSENNIFVDIANDRVGISSILPLAKLDVAGNIAINGVEVIDSSGVWQGSKAGIQGLQGIQGIQGITGAQGTTGAQGIQGIQGITGAQGTAGVIGVDGTQGTQGIQGITGAQGTTGTQGIQGITGAQGTTGTQGIQGITGAQGTTGTTGTTGTQGIQGITGAQGTTGTQGIQGITGAQGTTGTQGIQGITGAQGTTGTTGTTGTQGIQGATGINTWSRKTSIYTAVNGDRLIADTSGGTFTITLPATPSTGHSVVIADGADWSTTNLTVGRNGSTIEGAAENLTVDIGQIQIDLIYDGSTWEVFSTITSGGSAGFSAVTWILS
jgi:hypothetical protein